MIPNEALLWVSYWADDIPILSFLSHTSGYVRQDLSLIHASILNLSTSPLSKPFISQYYDRFWDWDNMDTKKTLTECARTPLSCGRTFWEVDVVRLFLSHFEWWRKFCSVSFRILMF